MAESLRYIDYSPDILVQEALSVANYSSGGFGYAVLREMPFDEYEVLISTINRAIKERENAS